MPEYIYIFRSRELCKIGRTKNVEKRLANFSDSPVPVEFVFAVLVTNSRKVESELHQKYQQLHVRGEWFALSDEQLSSLKLDMIQAGQPYESKRVIGSVDERLRQPKIEKPKRQVRPRGYELAPTAIDNLISLVHLARLAETTISAVFALANQSGVEIYKVPFGNNQIARMITQADAAKLAGVSISAIGEAIKRGDLRTYIKPDAPQRQGRTLVSRKQIQELWNK